VHTQSQHVEGAPLGHQLALFLVEPYAVFHRVEAGAHGVGDALAAVGVGGHALATPMRFLADRRRLLVAHFLVVWLDVGVVEAVA
jgi:hypothetical protein